MLRLRKYCCCSWLEVRFLDKERVFVEEEGEVSYVKLKEEVECDIE